MILKVAFARANACYSQPGKRFAQKDRGSWSKTISRHLRLASCMEMLLISISLEPAIQSVGKDNFTARTGTNALF